MIQADDNKIGSFSFTTVLPDGNGGYTPCPELLTEDEAIRYLRLDVSGPQNPQGTLKYYRDQGVLRAVQVGRNLRYPRKELDLMVEKLLEKRGDSR
jgi:hypothetical protein